MKRKRIAQQRHFLCWAGEPRSWQGLDRVQTRSLPATGRTGALSVAGEQAGCRGDSRWVEKRPDRVPRIIAVFTVTKSAGKPRVQQGSGST